MAVVVSADYLIGPGAVPLKDRALVYEDERIIKVGPAEECRAAYPSAEWKSFAGCILSPGFVNAHTHLYGILAHGIVPPVRITSFKEFLEDYWWPLVENLLDGPMIAAAARVSAAESLSSGVTALCDVLEAPSAGLAGLDAEAEVLSELGVRAVLSSESCERISRDAGERILAENIEFIRARRWGGLIEGFLCTHTAFTCSESFIRRAAALSEELGVSLQLHLSESRYEPEWTLREYGLRPSDWYDRCGILGPQLLAAQCVQLTAGEIDLLARRGVRAVHVPMSNCEVGGGVSPVPELLAAGVRVGLGSDGYVNDFFEVMRSAFLIHKGHREDPSLMDSRTVWRMATEGGADALYPGRSFGRLAPGCPADFIVIDVSDLPTPALESNLLDQLILFRCSRHVRESRIAGRAVKENGSLCGIDLAAACAESRIQAERLWAAGRTLASTR